MSPFQLARIFSSRNGFGRFSRASNIWARARSSAASTISRVIDSALAVSSMGLGVDSTVAPVPSKFPCGVTSKTAFATRAASSSLPHAASTSPGGAVSRCGTRITNCKPLSTMRWTG